MMIAVDLVELLMAIVEIEEGGFIGRRVILGYIWISVDVDAVTSFQL